MLFGVLQTRLHFTGWKETVLGLACTVAALALGMMAPHHRRKRGLDLHYLYLYLFCSSPSHVAFKAAP